MRYWREEEPFVTFPDKIVTDEVLEKFCRRLSRAPTNDHLRQFEFIVVRGRENIARLVAPVTENTRNIQQSRVEAAEAMDEDERAMFVDALPKQRRMLIESDCLVLPFPAEGIARCAGRRIKSSLNYFASAWAAVEISCWRRRLRGCRARSGFHRQRAGTCETARKALPRNTELPLRCRLCR